MDYTNPTGKDHSEMTEEARDAYVRSQLFLFFGARVYVFDVTPRPWD